MEPCGTWTFNSGTFILTLLGPFRVRRLNCCDLSGLATQRKPPCTASHHSPQCQASHESHASPQANSQELKDLAPPDSKSYANFHSSWFVILGMTPFNLPAGKAFPSFLFSLFAHRPAKRPSSWRFAKQSALRSFSVTVRKDVVSQSSPWNIQPRCRKKASLTKAVLVSFCSIHRHCLRKTLKEAQSSWCNGHRQDIG